MAPRPDPPSVPQALGRLRVALDAAYASAAREVGLSPQQAELLCAALRPAAVGELAGQLRCDRSNVTRLADRAELRGLVERVPATADRRVTMVGLTPEGERLARAFVARLEDQLAPLLRGWSARRSAATAETLDVLSGALEAAAAAR